MTGISAPLLRLSLASLVPVRLTDTFPPMTVPTQHVPDDSELPPAYKSGSSKNNEPTDILDGPVPRPALLFASVLSAKASSSPLLPLQSPGLARDLALNASASIDIDSLEGAPLAASKRWFRDQACTSDRPHLACKLV